MESSGGQQRESDNVLHESAHDANISEELDSTLETKLAATSAEVHIPDAVVAAGANPTKAEYDVLVGKFNDVLGVLRDAQLLPSA